MRLRTHRDLPQQLTVLLRNIKVCPFTIPQSATCDFGTTITFPLAENHNCKLKKERKALMALDFEKYKDKTGEIYEKVSDFTKEKLRPVDRYVIKRDVKTRTAIVDKEKGKTMTDAENSYSREYSALGVAAATVLALSAVCLLLCAAGDAMKYKKSFKAQKKELRRIKRACKKADVELPQEK